jgi:hypothetical protein
MIEIFKRRWRYILRRQRIDMEKEISGLKDQMYDLERTIEMFKKENQELKLVMGMMMSDEDAELFVNGQQIQFVPYRRFPDTPSFRNEMLSLASHRMEQAKTEGLL